MPRIGFLVATSTAAVIFLVALLWFYPSSQDFAPDNPFWNGLEKFVQERDVKVVSAEAVPEDGVGQVLILVPRGPLSPLEQATVQRFVSSGGALMLMDDFGGGNEIARGLGVEARFSGKPYLDPLVNTKNQQFPKATFQPQTGQRVVVAMNQPTSLGGVSPEDVLATSSRFSFLDENGNKRWDEGEPTGPFAVAAGFSLGQGQVVLVADPSVLTNSMLGQNREFVDWLMKRRTVMLYSGSWSKSPQAEAKQALGNGRDVLASPLGLTAVLTLSVVLPIFFLGPWKRD